MAQQRQNVVAGASFLTHHFRCSIVTELSSDPHIQVHNAVSLWSLASLQKALYVWSRNVEASCKLRAGHSSTDGPSLQCLGCAIADPIRLCATGIRYHTHCNNYLIYQALGTYLCRCVTSGLQTLALYLSVPLCA
ncbi:putative acetoacetate decarboxylase [Fusarium oxysporum f. sp. albedinis]|nr:putative acetoacetate decarboxylase [Fusarium oxysporum f. sp. albedinis]